MGVYPDIPPGPHSSKCVYMCWCVVAFHYNDVIMTTMASQITSLTVVYSTVYSDTDQRKHQSSASLAFVWGIHRDRWIPHTKGQLRGKCFHLMTSSCCGKKLIELNNNGPPGTDAWFDEYHNFIILSQYFQTDIWKTLCHTGLFIFVLSKKNLTRVGF